MEGEKKYEIIDQLVFQIVFPKSVKGSYLTQSYIFQINFDKILSQLTEKNTVQIMF